MLVFTHGPTTSTIKVLLRKSLQGVISFVSNAWGGHVSDRYITDYHRVFHHFIPSDIVLADRGFNISDSVAKIQASLHMVVFSKGHS